MPDEKRARTEAINERTATYRRRASEVAAQKFLGSPANVLVHGLSSEECNGLQQAVIAVFDRTAAFSMHLSKHQISLEVGSFRDLSAARFAVDSPFMKAHPLHVLDDPDDRRLDGRRVRIMVHPSVKTSNVHAECSDASQIRPLVLARAVVCLQ